MADAFVDCPECQRKVSATSARCPGCGFQFRMSEIEYRAKSLLGKVKEATVNRQVRKQDEEAAKAAERLASDTAEAERIALETSLGMMSPDEQMRRYKAKWKHGSRCPKCTADIPTNAFVCRRCGVRLSFDIPPI